MFAADFASLQSLAKALCFVSSVLHKHAGLSSPLHHHLVLLAIVACLAQGAPQVDGNETSHLAIKVTHKRRLPSAGPQPRCFDLVSDEHAVFGQFHQPAQAGKPWFQYLLWLDQVGLAGGIGMRRADPEALAYLAPPTGTSAIVNRCTQRQWSIFGNPIGTAMHVTMEGPSFMARMASFSDSRCNLEFTWNRERTEALITNYVWATWRVPLFDRFLRITITLNPFFKRLFDSVEGAHNFSTALQTAVSNEALGRRCCPGLFPLREAAIPMDVVAACRPPMVDECALWLRRNHPARSGYEGYSVYPVGYRSSGVWAAVPQNGTTAFAAFRHAMAKVGVNQLCFVRPT